MGESHLDAEAVFKASDYRYFHGPALTAERTRREDAAVRHLLDLRARAA